LAKQTRRGKERGGRKNEEGKKKGEKNSRNKRCQSVPELVVRGRRKGGKRRRAG